MSWACVLLSFLMIGVDIGGVSAASAPPGCVTLDAGFLWEKQLHIFQGDKYAKINDQGAEAYIGDISDIGGVRGPVGAALRWTGNNKYYVFTGPKHYRFDDPHTISGPYSNLYGWDSYFEEGIDAAGNINGDSYFFKGCTYRTWQSEKTGISTEKVLPSGLPCDIDAAWEFNAGSTRLALVKNDQMWIWGKDFLEGPMDFSKHYKLRSWTLCKHNVKDQRLLAKFVQFLHKLY